MTRFLSIDIWQPLAQQYSEQISSFTRKFREWRGKGRLHPVYDFLFTYYTYSSTKLEDWHPGLGTVLEFADDTRCRRMLKSRWYLLGRNGLMLDLEGARKRLLPELVQVHLLCRRILERPSRFSCFGLHEWAIVYGSDVTRHHYPLRLSLQEIEQVVETDTFCCSHYDAFRFCAPATKKLNVLHPESESRIDFEQGGCLHANMDLYKWCYKLLPLVSGELTLECFLLAKDAREIDMRASPYDFSALGFQAIEIEHPAGKQEYQQQQRRIAERAAALRQRLLDETREIIAFYRSKEAHAVTG
jgi:hypothetical protein